MNSWTNFLHGEGGGSLVNLSTRSKTGPMYFVKSAIYVSNEPSHRKETNPVFPQRHELREVRCADRGQIFLGPVRPRAQEQLYLNVSKRRFNGQDHQERELFT